MVIGIDASRANEKERTGTEWYSYHVIQELKQLTSDGPHQVVLYSREPLRDGLEDLPDNWSSHVLKWKPGLLWSHLRFSAHMLRNKPDVLFVPANTIPLIHPKKTVVAIHDIAFETRPELYGHKIIGSDSRPFLSKLINLGVKVATRGHYSASELDYHRWSTRHCIKHADQIVTVSYFSQRDIAEHFKVSENNITVTYPGFNLGMEPTAQDVLSVRSRYQLGPDPYLFYIGRVEKKKNIDRLLEAYGDIHRNIPHHLVLAGRPGEGYEEFMKIIEQKGIKEKVHLLGWTPQADYPSLLVGADLFVFPSLYEGFGIPILESFHAGVPVACSNVASLPEVAGDAAFLFDPESVENMSYTLLGALKFAEAREQSITKGRGRAKKFSWEQCARQTLDVLLKP